MKQHRNTRQRRLILEAVCARSDHPTADQIYLDVRAVDKMISRGTVYRNLNILTHQGTLSHVKLPYTDRFECNTRPHYHLHCTECDAVSDVTVSYQSELDKKVEDHTGYRIERHRTIFEGICPECQKKKD